MKIKNLFKFFLVLLVAVVLVGCGDDDEPTEQTPTISGAVDQTIEAGTKFVPKAGVTASDPQDGDLTDSIKVKTNVNYNVAGTYNVTYTVYDSDGNKAEVTITVTVVSTDKDAPIISGIANAEIIVGQVFDPLENVSAIDVVEGDLTSSIVVEGSVDTDKLGTYEVKYSVSDSSGNKVEATRVITVTLGFFGFRENEITDAAYENGKYEVVVSSGPIDTTLENFGLIKFSFSANVAEATDITIQIGAVSPYTYTLQAGENEYVKYIRFYEEFSDLPIIITTPVELTGLSLQFGEARDTVAPEIQVPADFEVVLPGNVSDPKVLAPFITSKLSATDDVDGLITSRLTVDFSSIDLGNFTGDAVIPVTVKDAAENECTVNVPVKFTKVYDTRFVQNPNFDTDDVSQFGLNGGGGNPKLEVINGELVHQTTTSGAPGWDSASSPHLRTTTETLKAGYWYMLKFDAYADVARKMTVRIGLMTTEANGWIENFAGASNYSTPLTTEKQTYYVIFYVHAEQSTTGSNGISIELKVGTYDWNSTTEEMNPVHFDNLQFYLLSNDNTAPEITPVKGLPTTFGKGQTLPSFTDYVEAYDLEDGGVLTLTSENVDLSKVDVNKAGTYPVTINVTDSDGSAASYTFNIKILEEADTEAPAITVENDNITMKQNKQASLFDVVKATAQDNVDGAIALTLENVSGEYDLGKVGTYTITISVKDSSGNEATKDVTINITDGEAPVISCDNVIDICIGDSVDLASLIKITDNVDGAIAFVPAFITGTYDLTTVGSYDVTITVTDAAGNTAELVVTIKVFPAMGDTYLVDDFEGYESEEALNNEDQTDIYRRWLPYGGTAQTLYDLELVEVDGEKAVKFSYNSGGESILYRAVKDTLPSKYKYLRLKMDTEADKLRVWFYTYTSGNLATALMEFNKLNYDEEGYYYIPLSSVNANAGDVYAVGISMNYQSKGSAAIVDDISFSTTCPETIKSDFIDLGDEVVIYDFLADQTAIAAVENATFEVANGEAAITVTSVGQWASAAKLKIYLSDLTYGDNYKVVITIKAEEERRIQFNIGQGLWSDPWMDHFIEAEADRQVVIGTEAKTYEVPFQYNKELRDGGPTMEFCIGQTWHAGDVEGNDMVITKFQIVKYVPVDPNAVIIDSATTDNSYYSFSSDYKTVTVSTMPATDGSKWFRWNFPTLSADVKQVTLTIKTEAGYTILAKLDGDGNPYDGKAGNKQKVATVDGDLVFTWNLEEIGMDPTKILKAVIWASDADQSVTATEIKLVSIITATEVEDNGGEEEPTYELPENAVEVTITSTNKDGNADYTFSEDFKTVTLNTIYTQSNKWGRFDFGKTTESYAKVVAVLKGTADLQLLVKVDTSSTPNNNAYDGVVGNKQYITFTDEYIVVEWDLAALNIPSTNLEKLVFWAYDADSGITEASFELVALYFLPAEVEEEPTYELPENAVEVTITSTNKDGNADYTFSEDFKTVTLNTIYTQSNKWGRFDFGKTTESYAKVVAVLKGTADLQLLVKVDTSSTPNNNAYDGVVGNKQYITFTDEYIVVEWDLAALNIPSTNLEKLVFWAYDADSGITEASFELVSLYYLPAEAAVETTEVEISGGYTDNQKYSYSADSKTVTVVTMPSSWSSWFRWDFNALAAGGTKVTLTVKTTAGYTLAAKIDGNGNPYDSVSGNKQSKATVDGDLVFEWDLKASNIDSSKIIKIVLWAFDADQSVTTTAIELVSIKVESVAVEEEEEEIDFSNYVALEWQPALGYWYSKDSGEKAYTLNTSQDKYISSGVRFTKEDIPVGSIIVVKEGYQYRPDAWTSETGNSGNRPDETTVSMVVVDEAWWGSYVYRAFNVSKVGKPSLTAANYEEFLEAFIIYVPKN